jgi:hypothetical protein
MFDEQRQNPSVDLLVRAKSIISTSPKNPSNYSQPFARRPFRAGFAFRSSARAPGRREASKGLDPRDLGAWRIWRCALCGSNCIQYATMSTRILLVVKDDPAFYHVMSRVALDGYSLGDVEKQYLL